jgi:hypothetical protein
VTRYRLIGACAVLALAICAVGTSSAFAVAPEFGRCVKLAKGESGEYSDANCTTKETGKYKWEPGAGEKHLFTSEGREVETTEAKRCLLWHEEIEAGFLEHAKELLEKWKYTEAQCEKAVKAYKCFQWLRRGGPKPPFWVGDTNYITPTEAECEAAATEWEEDYLEEVVQLETTSGDKVECEQETASGQYSGTKEVEKVVANFTNCVTTIFDTTVKCTSPGAAVGEIVTSALRGELGYIHDEVYEPKKSEVGVSLEAAPGAAISEFECGPGIPYVGSVKVKVTGSVIHKVTVNKMLLEEVEKFSESKGKQTPESFERGPKDVLETSINGGTPVESGEKLLTLLVNEEKIEVNTYV